MNAPGHVNEEHDERRGALEKYGPVSAGGVLSVLIYMVFTAQTDLEDKVQAQMERSDAAISRLSESVNQLAIQLTRATSGTQPSDVYKQVQALSDTVLTRSDVIGILQSEAPWSQDKPEFEKRIRELERSLDRVNLLFEGKRSSADNNPPKE